MVYQYAALAAWFGEDIVCCVWVFVFFRSVLKLQSIFEL